MGTRATYQKVLLTACLIAGDETLLAYRMGVPVRDVVDWLLGDRDLPPEMFVRAADIVLAGARKRVQDSASLVESNQLLLNGIRARHRYTPPAKA